MTRAHYRQNILRTKAHQITHDPEALREDIFVQRKALKEKQDMNVLLRRRHEKLEKENQEYEEFIQKNQYFWNTSDKGESKLLGALKRQQRQLEDKLRAKELEREEVMRSVKNTRLREMEIEIEELEDESKRLSTILAEVMQRPLGYDISDQK